MLIDDRVICDCCGAEVGHVMAQPEPDSDVVPDLSLPPHLVVCADCELPEGDEEEGSTV